MEFKFGLPEGSYSVSDIQDYFDNKSFGQLFDI